MRRLVLAFTATLAALAATAVLAGCGGSDPAEATDGGDQSGAADRNAADTTFTQTMISRHRQAVGMAGLAAERAADPTVKELAAQVEARQTAEITTMTGWLTSWGEPTEAPAPQGTGAGNPGIPAEMSPAFMAALTVATGDAFDLMFLEMMIRNHESAVETARAERRDGLFGPATQLAATIETAQTGEVTTMRRLLDQK